MKHVFLANYYKANQDDTQQPNQKQWYETLGGLVLLSIGLDILSAFLYEKGKDQFRALDSRRARRRERDHLHHFHGKTKEQAIDLENKEQISLDKQEQASSILN